MTKIRRVVTAQIGGKGALALDSDTPNIFPIGAGMVVTDIWQTSSVPAPLPTGPQTPDGAPLSLLPPANGTVFRIADFPPATDAPANAGAAAEVFAALGFAAGEAAESDPARAMMHKTRTIDYNIILEGELTLILEDGEVLLRAGDVIVQQGATHSWVNRSGKLARMASVMVDAADTE